MAQALHGSTAGTPPSLVKEALLLQCKIECLEGTTLFHFLDFIMSSPHVCVFFFGDYFYFFIFLDIFLFLSVEYIFLCMVDWVSLVIHSMSEPSPSSKYSWRLDLQKKLSSSFPFF